MTHAAGGAARRTSRDTHVPRRSPKMRERLRDAYYDALVYVPLRRRRELLYARWHRRWPQLDAPRTFNEKLAWRILHDRREQLTWTCDKQRMKEEAARRAPDVAAPRTLWFGTDLSELAHVELPERWILKPNHRSGAMVVRGHGPPDIGQLLTATRGWLGERQWQSLGEWAYDAARRAFLVEEWIGDESGAAPSDYKVYVFEGEPVVVQVIESRFGHKLEVFMTPQWTRSNLAFAWTDDRTPSRPELLDDVLSAAARIGAGFDFMRVDLYATRGRVWFGETTPYAGGGLEPFTSRRADLELGSQWRLPALAALAA